MTRRVSRGMLVVCAVACAMAATAGSAGAAEGRWYATPTCPVDAPAMLGVPAGPPVRCVRTYGNGDLKIGNVTGTIYAETNLGAIGADPVTAVDARQAFFLSSSFNNTWRAPLSSVCFTGGPPPRDPLYAAIANTVNTLCLLLRPLNQTLLFVSVEPAGAPSDFRVGGATGTGNVVTLPIKLRVRSDALGFSCTVGSDAAPILVHLTAAEGPATHASEPDANGYAVVYDNYSGGGAFSDTSFAAPGASGCGGYDSLVNTVLGVPSPAGSNAISVSRGVSMNSTTAGGTVLAAAYHAALG